MKATLKIILDPRGKGEKKALRLRVTYKRKPTVYTLGSKRLITQDEFNSRRTKEAKIAFEEVQAIYNQACVIVNELGNDFTFPEFSIRYHKALTGKSPSTTLFSSLVDTYLARTDLEPKTKILYRTASNWFFNVFDEGIKTNDIDSHAVQKLINKMKSKRVSLNSIRMYIRGLAAIYSYGIKKSYTSNQNPFRNIEGLTLTSTRRQNASLDDNELRQILSYKPQTEKERLGKDFFVLSMALCGMNIGDILRLTNEAIDSKNSLVTFTRKKISRLEEKTTIPLSKEAKKILSKYGKINHSAPHDYILPYLKIDDSEKTIINKIGRRVSKINEGLHLITEQIGLRKITTYTARHTFASMFQSKGMTVEQIQKFLGHSTSTTTQNYIGTLTTSIIEKGRTIIDELIVVDE